MPNSSLIPRKVLFENPDRSSVRLSRDGAYISWVAPREGVLNVWVAPRADKSNGVCLTQDTHRGIRQYFWAHDNKTILYIQDKDGDENWHVYALDIQTKTVRDLTPLTHVHAQVVQTSGHHPDHIVVGLNDRRPEFHDLYKVNIHTGERTILWSNDAYASFSVDHDLRPRFATQLTSTGGNEVYDITTGTPVLMTTIEMQDLITTGILGFNEDNTIAYMKDSRDRNTAALTQIDLKTGQRTVLAVDPQADMSDLLMHPMTHKVQAFASEYNRERWQILDPQLQPHLDYLWAFEEGDVAITSRTLDDRWWSVAYQKDDGPLRYHLYDTHTHKSEFLFTSQQALEGQPLVPMHCVTIPTRDGWDMVGYLSLPRDSDPGTGRPVKPLPMVLLVHGGPTARDNWGYNSQHQWLANRGYAVLSVNYRGSTGFGKDFIVAGYGQWAGQAHDDLIDAVHWAVDADIAIEDKVAIMGGSYGGYAALVGLAMTPKVFACGIDLVGPSNLVTLLSSVPPYWKPMLDMLKVRMGGDHETPQGRAFLESQSPLTFAHEICRPLLIAQGANDPRVKRAESDQIVQAMRAHAIPVTYLLYPDEGHGLQRPENRLSFYAVAERFLGNLLGGAVEEVGADFENSSLQILEGASAFTGLQKS